MKSYHPYNVENRTLDNFESTLKGYLKQLDEANLDELTNMLKNKGINADLTDGQKVLTMVVKEGQWDVQQIELIAKKTLEGKYKHITVIIETF